MKKINLNKAELIRKKFAPIKKFKLKKSIIITIASILLIYLLTYMYFYIKKQTIVSKATYSIEQIKQDNRVNWETMNIYAPITSSEITLEFGNFEFKIDKNIFYAAKIIVTLPVKDSGGEGYNLNSTLSDAKFYFEGIEIGMEDIVNVRIDTLRSRFYKKDKEQLFDINATGGFFSEIGATFSELDGTYKMSDFDLEGDDLPDNIDKISRQLKNSISLKQRISELAANNSDDKYYFRVAEITVKNNIDNNLITNSEIYLDNIGINEDDLFNLITAKIISFSPNPFDATIKLSASDNPDVFNYSFNFGSTDFVNISSSGILSGQENYIANFIATHTSIFNKFDYTDLVKVKINDIEFNISNNNFLNIIEESIAANYSNIEGRVIRASLNFAIKQILTNLTNTKDYNYNSDIVNDINDFINEGGTLKFNKSYNAAIDLFKKNSDTGSFDINPDLITSNWIISYNPRNIE